MATKNAYQIRLDVLCMAERLLVDKHRQGIEFAKIISNDNSNGNNKDKKPLPDIKYPTTSEIIAKAAELYAFIENKDEK